MSSLIGFFIVVHHMQRLELQKLMKLRYEKDTLRSTGLYKFMIFEILFNLLICPPKVDTVWKMKQLGGDFEISLDGLLLTLSLFRTYHLLRLYEQYSQWTNEKAIKAW